MINIATILTCYNRREKTVNCLTLLFEAQKAYNQSHSSEIELSIYLCDDACTDGTPEAVESICKGRDLHIIKGNGQCYWAGGMRLAWREALKRQEEWSFYLLLNDDTKVMPNVFEQLFACHEKAQDAFGKGGLYSGVTCGCNIPDKITYGGKIMDLHTHGWHLALPNGEPQLVDNTQANILLVTKDVVNAIGIFYDGYIHGAADEDYSMTARRNNFPVMVTAAVCGYCEFDHMTDAEETLKLMRMSFHERKKYVFHPTHSDLDYLMFVRRNMPNRYVVSLILRRLRLYLPSLYYKICKVRGIY